MRTRICRERMEEAKIIGLLGQMRHQLRDIFSGLAARLKVPERLGNIARRSFEGHRGHPRRFLPVIFKQIGLVVEGIDVTHRPRAINHQHLFGRRREMRRTHAIRITRINDRANGSPSRRKIHQIVRRQQLRKRKSSERQTGLTEKITPTEKTLTVER